tara:strand:+ start:2009 stop:2269 length:261 start_codon:yes stop_codon:yes gene_type:complete
MPDRNDPLTDFILRNEFIDNMPDRNDPLTDFILTLLDDDEGISEEAYGKLMYALALMNMTDLISWLDYNISAGDCRFYIYASTLVE